jgi:NitT/TauT family transport system permease protein
MKDILIIECNPKVASITSTTFAWHALIGAEILLSAYLGLGDILDVGREFQLMDQIIASMITSLVIGLVFDRLVFPKIG